VKLVLRQGLLSPFGAASRTFAPSHSRSEVLRLPGEPSTLLETSNVLGALIFR
jgi:hypothetical protein